MAQKRKKTNKFVIKGKLELRNFDPKEEPIPMIVEVRKGRKVLASTLVRDKSYNLSFEREKDLHSKLELIVRPARPAVGSHRIPVKKIIISPEQWETTESSGATIDVIVELVIWQYWSIRDVVVRGIVCKDLPIEGTTFTKCCPVPWAEIEVFDVDPNYMITAVDAVAAAKIPQSRFSRAYSEVISRKKSSLIKKPQFGSMSSNPHKSNPVIPAMFSGYMEAVIVGESLSLYTSQSLGKTVANECGEFEIVLKWLVCPCIDDFSPDLIFKVTQTIGPTGSEVTNTIISEGYNETRWEVPDYIYVQLTAPPDALAACNPNCKPFEERRVNWSGVGDQVIYTNIAQEPGVDNKSVGHVYNDAKDFHRSPFGEEIKLRAEFGSLIQEEGPRKYRVLYAKVDDENDEPTAEEWMPITDPLGDTCFWSEMAPGIGSVVNQKYVGLGPTTISGKNEYYDFRGLEDEDGNTLSWFDSNKVAEWDTTNVDDGLYLLKIEVVRTDGTLDNSVKYGDDLGKYARMYVYINNEKPVVEIIEVRRGENKISEICGSFTYAIGDTVSIKIDAYHPDDYLKSWGLRYKIGVKGNEGVIASEAISSPLYLISGKHSELVVWTTFQSDLPWDQCNVFGIALELGVQDNITDGVVLLGSGTGHYKEEKAGLAVTKSP